MVFKELEKEVQDELGEELKQLAKDYLKDEFMIFTKAKERFEKIEKTYNEHMNSEITEKFLGSKGYHIKSTREGF